MRYTRCLLQIAADTTTTASLRSSYNLVATSPYIRELRRAQHGDGRSGPSRLRDDFILQPGFFDQDECRQLLKMSLWKLDRVDSLRKRRRKGSSASPSTAESLQAVFEGDYGFEEGHYDTVIHHYRETLLSNFPPPNTDWPDLSSLMRRIYDLLPSPPPREPADNAPSAELPPPRTSTHILHLAPYGAILPHVDNLEASGSVIIGVSLGAERVLRLQAKDSNNGWDVLLPSGSLYLQRDSIRYDYEHSILPYDHEDSSWNGRPLDPGHRISIMVRDAPPSRDER